MRSTASAEGVEGKGGVFNVVCHGVAPETASILSGIPGHCIEDIKISDIYLTHEGGGTKEMAALRSPELEREYPEPDRFGSIPARGFFVRRAKNVEFSNVEIATENADARPTFWLQDVDGADFFRVKTGNGATAPVFWLETVKEFRVFGSRSVSDIELKDVTSRQL